MLTAADRLLVDLEAENKTLIRNRAKNKIKLN
jgi:hypothetical protein